LLGKPCALHDTTLITLWRSGVAGRKRGRSRLH
jgi:hypothetical protein